jgi:hypothetical protein
MRDWKAAILAVLWLVALLLPQAAWAQTAAPAAVDSPAQAQDTPSTVVDEPMSSYAIVSPKIFWHLYEPVTCDPDAHDKSWDDAIRRIAVQFSLIRELYRERAGGSQCASSITSNLVSDGNYVYFMRGRRQPRRPHRQLWGRVGRTGRRGRADAQPGDAAQ